MIRNDTYGEITQAEHDALRASAHRCSHCGMLADVDPVLHESRYGHRPKYRDESGKVLVWFAGRWAEKIDESAPGDDRCRAHCDSIYCHLPAGHPGLHETPASERLRTGGRHFGDLYPYGWDRGDSLADDRARHDDRVRQLNRMSKAGLRELALEQLRGMGLEPVYGGPAVMSKDELITRVIRHEFPGEDHCDPERCRWPFGSHSVYCVPGSVS